MVEDHKSIAFSYRPSVRRVKYGYRTGEVKLPEPGPAKIGTILHYRHVANVRRRAIVQSALGCEYIGASLPHPDMSHAGTIRRSIAKRVASNTPDPIPRLRRKFGRFVRDFVRRNFVPFATDTTFDCEEWLAGTDYPEWRRQQLRTTSSRVYEEYAGRSDRKRVEVKCFVKDECYLEYKHARAIYARVDEFKVIVGPIFQKIERIVYSRPEFIKHISAGKRPQYILDLLQKDGATYLATDYTAFESHFTSELMDICEFQLYRHFTQHHFDAADRMEFFCKTVAGVNQCVFTGLRAFIKACRMSGEMCTSLGNGFTNLMVFLFIMEHAGAKDYKCVVEGDDCLARFFSHDQAIHQKLSIIYYALGFNVKLEIHQDLCRASFCGLVFDQYELANIVNPTKYLLSTGWASAKFQESSDKVLKELVRGKALSLLYRCMGCPILQSFACWLLRGTSGYKYRIEDTWRREEIVEAIETGIVKPIAVGMGSRQLMEDVFGYTVVEQLSLEEFFDSKVAIEDWLHPIVDAHTNLDQRHCYEHYVFRGDMGGHPPLALPNEN